MPTDVLVDQGLNGAILNELTADRLLGIHAPCDHLHASPLLSFERNRAVEISWADLLERWISTESNPSSVKPLREYFERTWRLPSDDLSTMIDRVISAGHVAEVGEQVEEEDTPAEGEAEADAGETADAEDQFLRDVNGEPASLEAGSVVARHAVSGRWYWLVPLPETSFNSSEFLTPDGYEAVWQECVAGIERVYTRQEIARIPAPEPVEGENPGEGEEPPPTLSAVRPEAEDLDLRAAYIEGRYRELDTLRVFANKVDAKAFGKLDELVESVMGDTLNLDLLEEVQTRILNVRLKLRNVEQELRRLRQMAKEMQFILHVGLGDDVQAVMLPDGTEQTLVQGELYRRVFKPYTWTTQEKRALVDVGLQAIQYGFAALFTGRPQEIVTADPVRHKKKAIQYEKENTARNKLAEKIAELEQNALTVYVFDETPDGYRTADGTALATIMAQCEYDEAFRLQCSVMLPIYEESLTGERLISGYRIFKRPLPAIMPTSLPQLAMQESLTYRTAWKNTELGELVNTVNLAPGEERTVTITRSFQQETTVSSSKTSVFDLTRSESTDFSSAMESEAKQKLDSKSTVRTGQFAMGPMKKMSADTTLTLNNFSRSMEQVARKAAQSVNEQHKQEVSESSSTSTTVSNTETTTATLRNINEGRTLNLMFYRLYNRFEAGLFLEDLKFQVTSGVELISGSGVYETRTFEPGEIDRVLATMRQTPLPLDLTDEEWHEYDNDMLRAALRLLASDYLEGGAAEDLLQRFPQAASRPAPPMKVRKGSAKKGADDGNQHDPHPEGNNAATSVGRLTLPALAARNTPSSGRKVMPAAANKTAKTGELRDRVDDIGDVLAVFDFSESPLVKSSELLLASPGLYLDAVVGARPSTEPYSEQRRAEEVRMRQAEVFAKESEGLYQRAQAQRVASSSSINWLTGYLPDSENKHMLTLSLEFPLQPGDWDVMLGSERLGQLDTHSAFKRVVTLTAGNGAVLPTTPDQIRMIELVDSTDSTRRISFLEGPAS